MSETRYMIKEAARKLFVEPHVLRYWEEELNMNIKRNEMGHRYYTEEDIHILRQVRDLKSKGLQLKAIKTFLQSGQNSEEMKNMIMAAQKETQMKASEELNETVREESAVEEAAREKPVTEKTDYEEPAVEKPAIDETVPVVVEDKAPIITNQDKMEQFQIIMNRIIGNAIRENNKMIGQAAGQQVTETVVKQMHSMGAEHEAKEEERFQRLDATIRELQKVRMETAAAEIEATGGRKKRRGRRKKNT